MNTHLTTDRDRNLAETLKSLSLAPVADIIKPPKRRLRHLFIGGISAVTLAVITGIVLTQPDMVHSILSVAATFPDPTEKTADIGQLQVAQSSVRNTVAAPAAREITGSGFVVAPSTTAVFSKYEGRITHIAVGLGDRVETGQILVSLDDAGAHFALEQATVAKDMAELVLAGRTIELAQARASLTRIEMLATKNATTDQILEEARTAAERAMNALAQAAQERVRADLAIRIAKERVTELTVRAPFGGIVTRLDAHPGDTVLARIDSVRESQSLLTLADTAHLVIDADVAETNLASLRPGLGGEAVLDGFPDQPFAITILRLAPVVVAEKGTLALRLSVAAPPAGIRPNMAARIRIQLPEPTSPEMKP